MIRNEQSVDMLEYHRAPYEYDTLADPQLARKVDEFIEHNSNDEMNLWLEHYKEMIFSATFVEAETGRRAAGNIMANHTQSVFPVR